jgi:hypothetical protein
MSRQLVPVTCCGTAHFEAVPALEKHLVTLCNLLESLPVAVDGYAPAVVSPAVDNLVAQLTRLPGIGGAGRRSARIPHPPDAEAGGWRAGGGDRQVKERVCLPRVRQLTEEELCKICLTGAATDDDLCRRAAGRSGLARRWRIPLHRARGASPCRRRRSWHYASTSCRRVERNGRDVVRHEPSTTARRPRPLADRLRDRVRVTRLASAPRRRRPSTRTSHARPRARFGRRECRPHSAWPRRATSRCRGRRRCRDTRS